MLNVLCTLDEEVNGFFEQIDGAQSMVEVIRYTNI